MSNLATAIPSAQTLPGLVDRAAASLAGARTAAEVLEAGEMASLAYDVAKRTARLAAAKNAFDDLIPRIHRAQADALEIESKAKRRLADEYDAAQERGEVASRGGERSGREHSPVAPAAADLGISRKDIHEARLVRDAEEVDPGVVKRTVDEAIESGDEPTRAKVRRAVLKTVKPDAPPRPSRGRDAISQRVREALTALSGLPPASEVVGFLRGTDGAVTVDDHLPAAAAWLADFSNLWDDDHAE